MKTVSKLAISFAILLLASIAMSAFLCEKQAAAQDQTVTTANKAEASQTNPAAELPEPELAQQSESEGEATASASPPYADNQHTENDKREHGEIFLWGIKLGDWIAIGALAMSAILGTAALIFTGIGIRQNRISNEKQNRAYVTVDQCRIRRTANGMEAVVVLKNVGATPAKDISLTHWFGAARDYNAKLPRDGNIPMVAIEGNFFLGPTDKKTMLVKMEGANMPPEIFAGLMGGSWNLLLDGVMTYTDEFGKKHHLLYHFKRKLESDGFFGEMNFADGGLQSESV